MTRYTDTVVGVLWRLASRASAPAGAAAWSAWPRRAPHGTGGNCHGKIAGSVCDFGCRSSVRGCLQIWGFGDKSWTRIRSILVRGCPQIWGFGDDVSYAVSCNAVWGCLQIGGSETRTLPACRSATYGDASRFGGSERWPQQDVGRAERGHDPGAAPTRRQTAG